MIKKCYADLKPENFFVMDRNYSLFNHEKEVLFADGSIF